MSKDEKMICLAFAILFVVYVVTYFVLLGIFCLFVNYFFIDIFNVKNYIGMALLVSVCDYYRDLCKGVIRRKTLDILRNYEMYKESKEEVKRLEEEYKEKE